MSALTPWTMWALGGALYFYGFFQRIAPGVMVTELMRDLSMPASVLGNLSATYFYVYAAIQMPAGLLVDRYGTRRLLAGACAIAAVGSVVFAVAADAPTAFAGRLLVGIGAGFGWVGSLKIIADWFPAARFAQVSGLTLMLGLFGGLFAQGPLAAAIGAFGWRATVLAAAGIGVAVATMILAWLRDRRPPAEMPGERGLNLLAGLRSAAGNRQVWIASLHGLSVNAPVNGVIGLWGVPYLVAAYGLTRQDAAWAASVVVVGWALGSPLAGYLSDRLRRRRVTLIAGSGICALSLGAVVALPLPIPVLWPLLLVYGLSSGVTVVAYAVARENMPASASGAAIGFSNMIAVFGIALLQGATGWLLDFAWDGRVVDGVRVYDAHAYAIALGFYPLLIGAGHVLAYALRETQTR